MLSAPWRGRMDPRPPLICFGCQDWWCHTNTRRVWVLKKQGKRLDLEFYYDQEVRLGWGFILNGTKRGNTQTFLSTCSDVGWKGKGSGRTWKQSAVKYQKWSCFYEILHLYCWNQHLPNHQAFSLYPVNHQVCPVLPLNIYLLHL